MAGTHQLWGYDPPLGAPRPGRRQRPRGTGEDAPATPAGPALGPRAARPAARLRRRRDLVAARALPRRPDGPRRVSTAVGAGLFEGRCRRRRRGRPAAAPARAAPCRARLARGRHLQPPAAPLRRHQRRARDAGRLARRLRRRPGARPASTSRRASSSSTATALVADTNNHAVRRVDLAGGRVTTLQPAGLAPPGAAPLVLSPAGDAGRRSPRSASWGCGRRRGRRSTARSGAPVRVRVTATPPSCCRAAVERVDHELPASCPCCASRARGRGDAADRRARRLLRRDEGPGAGLPARGGGLGGRRGPAARTGRRRSSPPRPAPSATSRAGGGRASAGARAGRWCAARGRAPQQVTLAVGAGALRGEDDEGGVGRVHGGAPGGVVTPGRRWRDRNSPPLVTRHHGAAAPRLQPGAISADRGDRAPNGHVRAPPTPPPARPPSSARATPHTPPPPGLDAAPEQQTASPAGRLTAERGRRSSRAKGGASTATPEAG